MKIENRGRENRANELAAGSLAEALIREQDNNRAGQRNP
jgi:hypothetical protein